jgi:drug efflux transport system permease protein
VRLAAQVVKELLSNLRDPQTLVSLIAPPLLQLFVLAFAGTLEVRNVALAVVNDDSGRASYELIERIRAASFVRSVAVVDPDSMVQLLDRRSIVAGLHIPADFSRDVAASRPATVQVLIDGRRANSGQITLSYLQTIAAGYGAELVGARAAGIPQVEVRHWFNSNLIYQWFFVPAMIGVLVMFNSLVLTALSISRERELGTFDQLVVSPTSPFEIVVAKLLPAFVIASVPAGVMITLSVFVFGIPMGGSIPMLFLSVGLFIFSMVGIGLMLSAICATQQQAILGAFAVGYPLIMISGFATPVENMPHWLQIVAQASPLKHFLVIIEGSFTKAMPPADIFANTWPLIAIGVVTLSLAIVIVKRKLQW